MIGTSDDAATERSSTERRRHAGWHGGVSPPVVRAPGRRRSVIDTSDDAAT